jgi:YHS domain-containing protein
VLRVVLMMVLLLLVARAVMRFLGGVVDGAAGPDPRRRAAAGPAPTKMVQDPVCGTYVVPGRAVAVTRGRETLFFCSDACKQKFLSHSS